MAKIGEYRLRIYELLYEKPICEYAEEFDNYKRENVLILGNGWAGNEAFKAAFWAGQFPNTELNITVVSKNATKYRNQLLLTEEGADLPALKEYVEQKHYANLQFIDIDIQLDDNKSGLDLLNFATNRYNYVIISLGDTENNWLAASEAISQIGDARDFYEKYSGKVIVNVFNEFSNSINEDEQKLLVEYGMENDVEVHFFGTESGVTSELERIARNINFSYAMRYNQRVNRDEVDRQFEASREKEFVNSPYDYEAGDMGVVSNFIGANYAADSSFASSVHIPVKLALCKESVPDKNPLDTLKEAIQTKNKLYWELVALEHRRWNAYTVMRGFRVPSIREEEQLLYHNDNTHQDKKHLLHICLCECGEKAYLKNDFDHQYALWVQRKCPKDYPSELDRASLRVHQLTSHLAEKIDISQVLDEIKGNNIEYLNLRQSILKLFNDESNSLVLYQKALAAAMTYAGNMSIEEKSRILSVNRILEPVKIRNARVDFFSLDEQLVEMIPFALWYRKKYSTVITITDGMTTATYDVITPTLFCAKYALFIGKAINSQRYQKAVTAYFVNRGRNTVPQFIPLEKQDVETIYKCLEEQIDKYGHHDLIINCVPNKGFDAILAVGRLMEKYPGKVNAVQYLPEKGIISFSSDKNIGVGLDNKSYSFSEYIQLMGGRLDNEYAWLYDNTKYESLLSLFKKICGSKAYIKENGKKGKFNIWATVTGFISDVAKDEECEKVITAKPNGQVFQYTGEFSVDVVKNSRLRETLEQMENYHIIQRYSEQSNDDTVIISFESVNPEIADLLKQFEKEQITYNSSFKALKFIPLNGGLKITNCLVQKVPLGKSGELKEQMGVKESFLKELLKLGFIINLELSEDGLASFFFKDEATMQLLKSQGTIFELIVYYLMRESGKFDEVETGVKIAWDAEDITLEQQLLHELNMAGTKAFGYDIYLNARKEVLNCANQRQSVKNEVDVIALNGMNVTMVSCKTSDSDSMQWLYEIKSISDHFLSTGVMAVSSDYRNSSRSAFVARAKQMGTQLWGTETLWKPKQFEKALNILI